MYAIKGEDNETYYRHIDGVLDHRPNVTMDDGADLVGRLHTKRKDQLPEILAGTEETVFPLGLAPLVARLLAGAVPDEPVVLSWHH